MSAKQIVLDRGQKSGEYFIKRLDQSLSSAREQFRGIQGTLYETNGQNSVHDRYGLPAGNFLPGALALQATGWSKQVTVTGRFDSGTIYEQITKYIRVYREINHFEYASALKKTRPLNKPVAVGDFQQAGSIGYGGTPWGVQPGFYAVWWLLWETSGQTRGALIDFSYLGSYFSDSISGVDVFSGSPRANGLSHFQSAVADWDSTHGLKVTKTGDITYYINDVAGSAPTKTTENVSRPPQTIREAVTFQGESSVRFVAKRTSPLVGSDAIGLLPGASSQLSNLVWSNIEVMHGGVFVPLAVDPDDHKRITILSERRNSLPQPRALGGQTIVTSGAQANFINATVNISSNSAKGSPNTWVPNPVPHLGSDRYIGPIVVDGAVINSKYAYAANVGPYAIDNKWLAGHETPSDYWYILPTVKRTGSGGCQNVSATDPIRVVTTAATAADLFVNPALSCHLGRHFGKFLKSTVDSAGFSNVALTDWVNYIEDAGRANTAAIAADTRFTGYRRGLSSPNDGGRAVSANMAQPTFFPISFSLAGLPEFSGLKGGANINVGATQSGQQSSTLDPKTLTDLKSNFSTKKINSWTIDSITDFAKSEATRLGVSLFDLKPQLLELFLNAKTTWYVQEGGLGGAVARGAAESDPVYKALAGLVSTTSTTTGGASGSAGNSTQTKPKSAKNKAGTTANQTKTIRITVTRGLPGYRPGIRPSAVTSDRPELVQTYTYFEQQPDGTSKGVPAERRFPFPFVPREVNYSGLGTQWTEIERTGNFPIVDWQSFQLLKISFNFDIVDRKLENQTGFGLYWSCEDQIRDLREMAQAPYPVTFLNMDQFMSEEVRYPLFTRGRGIEFVIAEFSVTSVQRTPARASNIAEEIMPNQISRATASMTLQEIPIETIDIVQMPPIKPCNKKNKKCDDTPPPPPPGSRSYVLFTPSVKT